MDVGFPQRNLPLVDKVGQIQQVWFQMLLALWNRTGAGTGQTGEQATFWAGAAGGTATALVLTVSSTAFLGYANGQRFVFQAGFANPGPATAKINTFAALPLRKANELPLVDNDLGAGRYYELVVADDGAAFQVSELMPQSPQQILADLAGVDLGATILLPTQIFGP